MPDPVTIRHPLPHEHRAIARLWRAALDAGELPGFESAEIEPFVARLAVDTSGTFVAAVGDQIAGFLYEQPHIIVVDPTYRRRGIGRHLVEHAESEFAGHGERLLIWRPEGSAPAARFLTALDYAYHASLWLMTLLEAEPVPAPLFPRTVELRRVDEVLLTDYVAMVNAAFQDHPTPIHVTTEVVEWAHSREHFDPSTILVLRAHASGDLIGMARVSPGDATGEVDLIGLLPGWRGRGLGRELLRWSVLALRERGAGSITLRVEGNNPAALHLYERTGFTRTQEWRRFARRLPDETMGIRPL